VTYKSLELSKPVTYELEGLEVGVTSNCNFKCDYCCAYQRNDGQSINGKEIIRILEDIPTLKRVRLSGGEVTLKFQDCLEVVSYCTSRGIATQLNTNASLLNAERVRQLHDAGVSNIHISFNFTSADKFAAYYNLHPGVYEKILENIRLCVAAGIDTVLETLLFAETQHNMEAISEMVYRLGVRTHEIQNSILMDHTGWNAISARDELKRAVAELIEMKKEDTVLYFTCMDRFAEALGFREQPDVHFSHCVDGKKQLHLHGNGDVLICELCHPVVIGNIYQGTSLKDLYANKPAPLAEYLEKQPCPALDVLFPEGI
jgi:MoaA/NifB/PqqE/SkfB family radical SAM enzyme